MTKDELLKKVQDQNYTETELEKLVEMGIEEIEKNEEIETLRELENTHTKMPAFYGGAYMNIFDKFKSKGGDDWEGDFHSLVEEVEIKTINEIKDIIKKAVPRQSKKKRRYISEIIDLFRVVRPINKLSIFLEIENSLKSPDVFWKVFVSIWQGSEDVWNKMDDFKKVLKKHGRKSFGDKDKCIMSKEEINKLKNLPEVFNVYRGYQIKPSDIKKDIFYRTGWSYSRDLDVAKYFSIRFSRKNGFPYVATCRVKKKDVIAYLGDQDESEILINPKDVYVTNISFIPLEEKLAGVRYALKKHQKNTKKKGNTNN